MLLADAVLGQRDLAVHIIVEPRHGFTVDRFLQNVAGRIVGAGHLDQAIKFVVLSLKLE